MVKDFSLCRQQETLKKRSDFIGETKCFKEATVLCAQVRVEIGGECVCGAEFSSVQSLSRVQLFATP